jgi:predicted nuclease of predicted toxin-antitoxin system
MKILLDESLPRKLRNDFGVEHEVWTVRDKGWLGKKNGELLKLMTESKFDLFVTVDRNLKFQQNLTFFSLTIIVLWGVDNRRNTLKELLPKIFQQLNSANIHTVIEIF